MRRIALLLALVLVAAACGGDDRAEIYVSAIEGIGRAQLVSASQIIPATPEGVESATPTLAQISALKELRRGALEDVNALEPPDELAGRHARFVATLATVVAALDLLIITIETSGDGSIVLTPAEVIAAQQAFDGECDALEIEAADLLGRTVDLSC
ncbi:hypothetical protein HQ535_09530 [bacterium]|nr:hypothetical protein [bacterium]